MIESFCCVAKPLCLGFESLAKWLISTGKLLIRRILDTKKELDLEE